MDREARWATVCGVRELDMTELLALSLSLHKQSIKGFPGDSAIKNPPHLPSRRHRFDS